MGIVNFPYNKPMPEKVSCALCGRDIPMSDATLGSINADGKVSLFCNGHLWDGLKFIDELADYMANERRRFFRANNQNLMQFGVSPNVRSIH